MENTEGSENGQGTPRASLKVGEPSDKGKPRRAGGPRTPRGKTIASKNATRHGILSDSPVISGENEEDWIAHLEGMRASWEPVGHYEEVLVHKAAFSLWRRARLDHWAKGIVDQQIALWHFDDVFEDDPAKPRPLYPAWSLTADATSSVLAALDGLETQSDNFPMPSADAAGILAALRDSRRAKWNTKWPGLPDRMDPAEFESWTAGQVRQCIEVVADGCRSSYGHVFKAVRKVVEDVTLYNQLGDEYNEHRRAMDLYRATMLMGPDAELEMRYAAHLDREFARILKQFEEVQRARTNDLPPPIRVEITPSAAL